MTDKIRVIIILIMVMIGVTVQATTQDVVSVNNAQSRELEAPKVITTLDIISEDLDRMSGPLVGAFIYTLGVITLFISAKWGAEKYRDYDLITVGPILLSLAGLSLMIITPFFAGWIML